MTWDPRSVFRTHSRAALGAGFGLGICAIVCAASVLLTTLGVGVASALVCNLYEAAGFIAVAGAAATGAVFLSRKRTRAADKACACAAAGRVGSGESDVPIACDLGVFTADERNAHLERGLQIFSAIWEFREEADGFVFAFEADPTLEKAVVSWIEGERRCCPFFRFELERIPSGRLSLRITGPAAAKEILRAGFEEYGEASTVSRGRRVANPPLSPAARSRLARRGPCA
jgi:hypothetical protein